MNRWLIAIGVLLILIGLAWPWIVKIPFGRLPGDVHVEQPGFSFHFPWVTCLIVSLVISLILWFWRR